MTSIRQEQLEAASAFAAETINLLQTEQGVHAETAIASAARMAGTFLLRSFGFQLDRMAPGTVILSEAANTEGPRLIQLLGGALTSLGVELDPNRLDGSVPQTAQPQLSFLESQARLEPGFVAIKERCGLSDREAAEAAALATATLVRMCADVLDSHAAFGIAMYGFVEGSKTVPGSTAK